MDDLSNPPPPLEPAMPKNRTADSTPDRTDQRFDRLLERLHETLPHRMAVAVAWVIRPEMIWVRLPLAVLLLAGGVFSFLPLLGAWMLPLGIMLLAVDIRPVRSWVVRVWPKIEARIRLFRAKRAKRKQAEIETNTKTNTKTKTKTKT